MVVHPNNMILPYINSLTGLYIMERPSIHEQIVTNYKIYSENYWRGVRVRQLEYRRQQKLEAEQYKANLQKPKTAPLKLISSVEKNVVQNAIGPSTCCSSCL